MKAWLNTKQIHLNRAVMITGTLVSAGALLFAPVEVYTSLFKSENGQLVDCAKQVAALVPENHLIIASSAYLSIDRGVPNNYQDPEIFYYSHRYGWSLAADQHTPEMLDKYRQEGGQYFVIYSQSLYNANPALVQYLEQNTTQIGPGIEKGCAIYQLGGQDTNSDSDDHADLTENVN